MKIQTIFRCLSTLRQYSLAFALMLCAPVVLSDEPLLARTHIPFDETIDAVKTALQEKGYTVVHTQKCDNALGHYDYATDSYRVLLYSKLSFTQDYLAKYPQLAGFLPLRLAVFAEGHDTMLASYNPSDLFAKVKIDELAPFFERWEKDIKGIMQELSTRQIVGQEDVSFNSVVSDLMFF